MTEINTFYTLADHIYLEIRATVSKKGADYIINELEILHDGNHTTVSRLSVYPFAGVEPISVEDDIVNLVMSKIDE